MIDTRTVLLDVRMKNPAAGGGTSDNHAPVINADSEAAGAEAGSKAGAEAGGAVELDNAPFYYTSTVDKPSVHKSGTFYFYDGKLINGRYRITNGKDRCGKLPVGVNVTGWVPASYCMGSGDGEKKQSGGTKSTVEDWASLAGQAGGDIESLTYTDNAADESDAIDVTLDAQEEKWLNGWMPEEGATLRPKITGYNWEADGDTRTMECGLFVLDDVSFQDSPSTLQVSGVSKPSDSDFSELEREYTWKNTSIKRIGQTIAGRYGLGFSFDGEDYDIECDEQDGTDSSYYKELCGNYGLILKVYAKRLWVYDREKYKEKPPVKTYDRTQIIKGSFKYNATLSGTFTGGQFSYTDPDTDSDISCKIGGGKHTKNVSRRATSVQDASVQLCAEINAANHGNKTVSFSVDGEWSVSAANNIQLTGYGEKVSGKYFVDRATHHWTREGGFTTDFECSKVEAAVHPWDVGGTIEYHQGEDASSEDYSSAYEDTSPAANAASDAAGAEAGGAVTLNNAPFYYTSVAASPSVHKSGTFYYYDGILINGRYRITNSADRCGKLPVGKNVTGWVPASYCTGSADAGSGTDL